VVSVDRAAVNGGLAPKAQAPHLSGQSVMGQTGADIVSVGRAAVNGGLAPKAQAPHLSGQSVMGQTGN
ncbi:MAG: hypothetical protein ACKOD9_18370, partial [Rubrivivax sp.]